MAAGWGRQHQEDNSSLPRARKLDEDLERRGKAGKKDGKNKCLGG